jgi:hypothetical protein
MRRSTSSARTPWGIEVRTNVGLPDRAASKLHPGSRNASEPHEKSRTRSIPSGHGFFVSRVGQMARTLLACGPLAP